VPLIPPRTRGGLELSTGTGLYGECRSTQCCLAVWSRWVESSTRLGGLRALKKTPEVPYTTKVNYRKHTSRRAVELPYSLLYRVFSQAGFSFGYSTRLHCPLIESRGAGARRGGSRSWVCRGDTAADRCEPVRLRACEVRCVWAAPA
jgi:hypothetical protein